ncbi:MAG: M12 family metallopeptidase [Legionella sp.]|nr:M12 family metallopeptidase [Legionella sp.]
MKTIQALVTCSFILTCTIGSATPVKTIYFEDPLLGYRSITYAEINKYAMVEGDIIIGRLTDLNNPFAIIRPKIGGGLWPEKIIPYEIADEMPIGNKRAISEAISHWEKNTSIRFVEISSTDKTSYQDYIAFIPATGTTCSSFVGRQGGRQELNLAPRCTNMNTVHEIGHALGLWHEQSRADRDNYVSIVWDNIDDEHRYNFDQHLSDGFDFGEYDYQSIMHYSAYAFTKNGEKTIIPLVDGVTIGQRNQLSEKDIAAIDAMYAET